MEKWKEGFALLVTILWSNFGKATVSLYSPDTLTITPSINFECF